MRLSSATGSIRMGIACSWSDALLLVYADRALWRLLCAPPGLSTSIKPRWTQSYTEAAQGLYFG